MKILAIDDNPDNLTVLTAVLRDRLPYAGLVAALNGPKGLDLAGSEDPDVILLDIVMPGVDGYEVCRKLKADAHLKAIPVLFLTAHTDRDSRIKALEAGADGFLSKPFDELELTVQIVAMSKLKAANRLQRLEKEELAKLVSERTRELEQELADRKLSEGYREMGRQILQILNDTSDFQDCLRRVLAVLKTGTGVDAIGIRLQDGEDFPYFIQEGFSEDFLRTQNSLLSRSAGGVVCRDSEGKPCLECTCGLVISGAPAQASPLFTPGGSFWTNNSPTLLDIPRDEDPRFHPRNVCIRCGYASVALIPIRAQDKIVGLIQFNDRRKDRFTIGTVELAEGVAAHIGEALARKQAEDSAKQEQTLTRAIIESIPGAFYMLDKNGRYVRWNAYLRDEIVGRPEAMLAGSDAISCIHPEDREPISAKFASVLEHGVHETVEGRVLLKGGPAFRWFLLTGRKMVVDGSPFLLGIGMDITERKEMEEVNAFLSTVRAKESSESFFSALARFLAENLGMDFVCVDRLMGDGLTAETLAVWGDGRFEDNVTYALKDTPCGDVVGQSVCCFPSGVRQLFPRDLVLQDLRAESYLGVTLFNHRGQPIGLIAVIGRVPLANRPKAETTMKRVSQFAAIELERLNAEEVLKNSESLLRQSQEVAGIGSYRLNITTGRWVGSDVLDKVFGIDQVPDHSVEEWIDLIHPDDRMKMADYFQNEVLGKRRSFNREYRVIRRSDHAEIWVSGLGKLEFDNDGRPVAMFGTIQDITKRKQSEAELQILRTAVEQSANTIMIADPTGNIEYVNPAFEKSTGYSIAEAIGQNPRFLKSGENGPEFYRNLWGTITSGNVWRGEFHNRRKDGSLYWEAATISPVQNEIGEPVHFIAIKEDITGRKALEARLNDALHRAEEGIRTKSEFLAIMSHELRTPLNGVLGFAELLADTPLDDEQKTYAKTITKSGNHLLAIVNDILDFSSIEKGAMSVRAAPFVFAGLVKSSEEAVRKSAMDKGILFQTVIGPLVPEHILGDEQRILQILINLLGNAVKFTSSGSVTLRVETATEAGAQFLDFSVEDTGVGMPPETIGILFEPFTQADMKMNRTFGGTGLGLAISKRLAEAMGGTITVTSAEHKGSTFTFRLPLETSLPSSAPPASAPCDLDSTRPSGSMVLVVEDDRNCSVLAGKMLQGLGYQAEFAADGAEAVKAFVPGKFSAILMDMAMPVMDGIGATRKIREIEADAGVHVPVIALTANVMPGDREKCLAAGMDDFLSKPFKKAELAAKLASVARR